jgi:hypothetical protein
VETTYDCAYCGQTNDLYVDPSGGVRQQYVEDCQVCCRPNLITAVLADDDEVVVQVERENA